MTVPATGVAPGPVTVKVVALIVAGFIALLNVVVITVVLAEATVEPFSGLTEVTLGEVRGLPGLSTSPFLPEHPATKAANRNATNDIFPVLNLRIGFFFFTSDKAFLFDSMAAVHERSLSL